MSKLINTNKYNTSISNLGSLVRRVTFSGTHGGRTSLPLTQSLRVHDESEVLLVENPVQLLQRGVQGDPAVGGVGGLAHRVGRLDLALQQLRLEAAQGGDAAHLTGKG